MKYIVYQDGNAEMLIVFPRCIDHDRMAEALEALRFGSERDWHRRQGKVLSAGFIDNGKCHGRSETLNLNSRGQTDTELYNAGGSWLIKEGGATSQEIEP